MMNLTIENLSVALQKEEILHGINLEIQTGEFVSLLGPSGCGKSTLLKSVAGLLEIGGGDVRLDGESIVQLAPEKRGTIIVFQDLRLFPHMTVEKNIAFAMELKRVPKAVQRETVKRLLAEVQLTGYEKRKIREMSGGQLQRVALARALAAEPKILLLDEPFSGLDEKLRLEMETLVKKLHQEKQLTTILVTHDKHEALRMSDRVALMSQGRIVQYDTPEMLFRHPVSREAAEYFGKANYIRGTAADGWFRCSLGSWKTDRQKGIYDAMLRPSDIILQAETVVGCSRGVIEEMTFMGETVELKVRTEENLLLCHMLSGEAGRMGITIGDTVGTSANHEMAVYYTAGEQPAAISA